MKACFLTTIDNPYDPLDDFDNWYRYDCIDNDYHSCAKLARIARTSDQLSDAENAQAIEDAIDDIIRLDFLGIYKKLVVEVEDVKPIDVPKDDIGLEYDLAFT